MSLFDSPSPFAPKRKPPGKRPGNHAGANGASSFAGWEGLLLKNGHGTPKAVMANAEIAFRHSGEWAGRLALNDFAGEVWDRQKRHFWSELEDLRAASWMQRQGISITPAVVRQAVELVAADDMFHPVRDYLASLAWDGEHRLDEWARRYLGAEDSDYLRAVASRWMISAVARIMHPGCKADCLLVLEGPQGAMKSTALKTLGDPWFTDELAEVGSKDAAMQISGVWIIEISELDSIKRRETSHVKAFLSRTHDRFRPPYGRSIVMRPRQAVFAATTNESEWGRDDTGLRRFWPIACGRIDIDGLTAARDQLWAEARDRYEAGEKWWLDTPELNSQARIEQEARQASDTWLEFIDEFSRARSSVSVAECLKELGFQTREHDRSSQMRVAACLKQLGYQRYNHYSEGAREWRYRQNVPTNPN